MYDIHVHPPALRGSAGAVRTTAEQVQPKAGHWLDDSLTAARAEPAWQSSAALASCANAWQARMAATVQQLHSYADRLDQSADSYDAADAEASRRFHAALTDLNAE